MEPHRQFDHRRSLLPHPHEGIQNGVADPAFKPVIFDHHEPASRDLGGLVQGLFVDRLDRIGVRRRAPGCLPT